MGNDRNPGETFQLAGIGIAAAENAQLVFELDQGLTVGYGGQYVCEG